MSLTFLLTFIFFTLTLILLKNLSDTYQALKTVIGNNKKFIPIIVGILVLPITLILLSQVQDLRSRASDETLPLLDNNISAESTIEKTPKTVRFNLDSFDKSLMNLPAPNDEGVKEVLRRSPRKPKELKTIDDKPKKDTEESVSKLLPNNFHEKSVLKSKIEEPRNERGNKLTHYRYNQKIKGLPVYGAELSMHVRNKTEVYALSGNLITDETTPDSILTQKDAELRVIMQAQNEQPFNTPPQIIQSEKIIFNGKAIGISEDENNHTAQLVVVIGPEGTNFEKKYIVDLVNGEILLKENLILDINREISECFSGLCIVSGTETQPPQSGDSLKAFNSFGTTYNFFLSTFGRNSYNNSDELIKAQVNVGTIGRNATWSPTQKTFKFSPGMVFPDIVAHEFTHAVTEYTAGLAYSFQSGALNEAISDMMGSTADNNWILGEGSAVGVFRDMSNPPSYADPDRLSSSLFVCATTATKENDYGGVHTNSGIPNKAYYLMVAGGRFNNCTISGIGRSTANKILYRALTVPYLTSYSNFYDFYTAMLNACNDLYGSGSTTCDQVKKAMQAVEIDQQPLSSQRGPLCKDTRRTGTVIKAATCATTTTSPTPTLAIPTPTSTQTSSAATIKTPTPGSTISTSSVTFSWNPVPGASYYNLYVGTTGAGSSNVYGSQVTSTAITVSSIPISGSSGATSGQLYVRLWTNGVSYNDYIYTLGSLSVTPTRTPTPTALSGGCPNVNPNGSTNVCRAGNGCPRNETIKIDGASACTTSLGTTAQCCTKKTTASTPTPTTLLTPTTTPTKTPTPARRRN